MHSSANVQSPPLSVVLLCSCDNVYHKQDVRFFVFTRSDCHLTISLIHWNKMNHVLL